MIKEWMMNRKADLSITWIVTIILLVLGFAILLIFYFNISPTPTIDNEVCHQSVILRGSLPQAATSFVPLKCKTNKICIVPGGISNLLYTPNCTDFAGEKGITTIKVTNPDEIAQIYANSILDCWSMMGEGKLTLYSNFLVDNYGLGDTYSSCVICDRIAFDKNTFIKLDFTPSKVDIQGYMLTHMVPGKNISYYEYMAGNDAKLSVPTLSSQITPTSSIKIGDTNTDATLTQTALDINDNSLNSTAILFMQVSAPKVSTVFKNTLTTLGALFWGGSSIVPKGTFVQFGQARNALGQFTSGKAWSFTKFGKVATPLIATAIAAGAVIQSYHVMNNRYFTASQCGDVVAGSQAYSGCSVVRSVAYNTTEIASYCGVIESTP